MHDLRRTLATVATNMDIPSIVVARLLNHAPVSVTGIYATPSLEDLRKYMPRIEAEIFKYAPFVNATN
jgi:integrase